MLVCVWNNYKAGCRFKCLWDILNRLSSWIFHLTSISALIFIIFFLLPLYCMVVIVVKVYLSPFFSSSFFFMFSPSYIHQYNLNLSRSIYPVTYLFYLFYLSFHPFLWSIIYPSINAYMKPSISTIHPFALYLFIHSLTF